MELRQMYKKPDIKTVLRYRWFSRVGYERVSDGLMKAILKWRANVKSPLSSAK